MTHFRSSTAHHPLTDLVTYTPSRNRGGVWDAWVGDLKVGSISMEIDRTSIRPGFSYSYESFLDGTSKTIDTPSLEEVLTIFTQKVESLIVYLADVLEKVNHHNKESYVLEQNAVAPE